MSGKSLADRTVNIKARMAVAQSAVHVRQLGKCDDKCRDLFQTMAGARANIGISVRDRDCVLLLGSAVHAVQGDLPLSARMCAAAWFCCACCAV